MLPFLYPFTDLKSVYRHCIRPALRIFSVTASNLLRAIQRTVSGTRSIILSSLWHLSTGYISYLVNICLVIVDLLFDPSHFTKYTPD